MPFIRGMQNERLSLLARTWWEIEDLINSIFDFLGGLLIVCVVSVVVGAIPYGLIWLFFNLIGLETDHQLAIQIGATTIIGHFLIWWKHMRDSSDEALDLPIRRHQDGRFVLNTGMTKSREKRSAMGDRFCLSDMKE